MPGIRRGLWAETAPDEALRDAATYRLLARYGLEVAMAVRPVDVAHVEVWLRRAAEHGVRASVWPMLEDGDGRWLSTANVGPFRDFVREVRARAPGAGVVLDLEPPFPLVRGALDRRGGALGRLLSLARDSEPRRAGERLIEALCRELHEDGAGPTLAVVPLVLLDGEGGRSGWGRLCGAPWGLPAARVSLMLYTSLIEGYSRGALRREDARALLADGCRAAASRLGAAASVSLGAVGLGALGDEPIYRSPDELADDAATALLAGVRDLWLFDLGGALRRGPPEPWLDAFVTPPRRGPAPRPTARSRAVIAALWGAGRAISSPLVAEYGTFPRGL